MPVPLLDVNAQNLPLERELTEAFTRVLRSGRFILGEEVEAFERECAAFLGAKFALGVTSGTPALMTAMAALEVDPGDEVILPAWTWYACYDAIILSGALPVFAEIDGS